MQITLSDTISIMKLSLEDLVSIKADILLEDYVNASFLNLQKTLNDDRIFSDLERTVLALSSFGQSYRNIASEVNLSHTKVSLVNRDAMRKLKALRNVYLSKDFTFLDLDDHLLTVLSYHDFIEMEPSTFDEMYSQWVLMKDEIFEDCALSEDDRDRVLKSLGMKGILSRRFIEYVKNRVAEEFGVGKIELVGSYRRGEAKERSDVDLLILDESYPKGMKFLQMIGRFEDLLGKEVGLVTKSGLSQDFMKKTVLESMMEDIANYA